MKILKIGSILCSILLVSFGLTGCYLFPKEEAVTAPPLVKPKAITYETAEVKKGSIENKITGFASVISVEQKDLSFTYRGGRLKSINVKAGDDVKKGAVLAELDTDSLISQIEEQKISLQKAQIIYDQASSKGDKDSTALASLDVKLEQIKLNDLQNEFDKAKLISPISGHVDYLDSKVNVGDEVAAYQVIMRIADPSKLQLMYNGTDISKLQLGMKIDVTVNSKQLKGTVVMTPANIPSNADDSLKNSVQIKVDDIPSGTSIGDQAEIKAVLQKKDNVIVLPKSLVQNYDGRHFVQVLKNGLKSERDVETGMETGADIEITKGLEVGEKVIVQ